MAKGCVREASARQVKKPNKYNQPCPEYIFMHYGVLKSEHTIWIINGRYAG